MNRMSLAIGESVTSALDGTSSNNISTNLPEDFLFFALILNSIDFKRILFKSVFFFNHNLICEIKCSEGEKNLSWVYLD